MSTNKVDDFQEHDETHALLLIDCKRYMLCSKMMISYANYVHVRFVESK